MSIGVAVCHEDVSIVDDVVDAIDRAEGMHVAPTPEQAAVVLAGGKHLRGLGGHGLVILSTEEAFDDVRAGLEAGARGWLRWPIDMHDLGRVVGRAAAELRTPTTSRGRVVAVIGARGGAGTSTIACLFAATHADALMVDLTGGQRSWAPEGARRDSLARVLASPLVDVIESAAEPHAAGRAIYGNAGQADGFSLDVFLDAARLVSPFIVVDARRSGSWADKTVLVCADDLVSLRCASEAPHDPDVILNRLRGRAIKRSHVRQILGREPIGVLRRTPSIARAADLGSLPTGRVLRRVAGWLA